MCDLADKAGLSTDYYTRLFRQITGMTPKNYISYYRISMAKDLLADPYLPDFYSLAHN